MILFVVVYNYTTHHHSAFDFSSLPSGNVACRFKNGPLIVDLLIVELPIELGDFPVRYLSWPVPPLEQSHEVWDLRSPGLCAEKPVLNCPGSTLNVGAAQAMVRCWCWAQHNWSSESECCIHSTRKTMCVYTNTHAWYIYIHIYTYIYVYIYTYVYTLYTYYIYVLYI